MFRVENLNVAYGVVHVLHDVNIHVEEGECVALLGSNGAGKTTVLNTISGLLQAKIGNIFFYDEPITGLPPGRRVELGIIQIPEGCKLFPFMTVTENLLIGSSGRREAWKTKKTSLKRVYELFPILKERGNLHAHLLSGGERQMLAMGRALMAQPNLLMMDEPSIGLSPIAIIDLYATLKMLHDGGVTILLAEQNVQQALGIATRGYVLENGHIVIEGSSDELLNSEHVKKAYIGL
jgi:branched-chain amino acid transport system ATP-binding protein